MNRRWSSKAFGLFILLTAFSFNQQLLILSNTNWWFDAIGAVPLPFTRFHQDPHRTSLKSIWWKCLLWHRYLSIANKQVNMTTWNNKTLARWKSTDCDVPTTTTMLVDIKIYMNFCVLYSINCKWLQCSAAFHTARHVNVCVLSHTNPLKVHHWIRIHFEQTTNPLSLPMMMMTNRSRTSRTGAPVDEEHSEFCTLQLFIAIANSRKGEITFCDCRRRWRPRLGFESTHTHSHTHSAICCFHLFIYFYCWRRRRRRCIQSNWIEWKLLAVAAACTALNTIFNFLFIFSLQFIRRRSAGVCTVYARSSTQTISIRCEL